MSFSASCSYLQMSEWSWLFDKRRLNVSLQFLRRSVSPTLLKTNLFVSRNGQFTSLRLSMKCTLLLNPREIYDTRCYNATFLFFFVQHFSLWTVTLPLYFDNNVFYTENCCRFSQMLPFQSAVTLIVNSFLLKTGSIKYLYLTCTLVNWNICPLTDYCRINCFLQ